MIVEMQNNDVVEEEDEVARWVRLGSASGFGGNNKGELIVERSRVK